MFSDGENYQIVSKSSATSASVAVSSITTALDTHLKFSSSLGGVSSDSANYRIKYTDAAWLGGTATVVNGDSNLTVSSGDNTFQPLLMEQIRLQLLFLMTRMRLMEI